MTTNPSSLEAKVEKLLELVQAQQSRITELEARIASLPVHPSSTQTRFQTLPHHGRRRFLKKMAGLVLVGGISTSAALANATSAEAKMTIHPTGNGMSGRVGALLQPPGAVAPTGTLGYTNNFGLIVTSDSTALDLSTLSYAGLVDNVGVYGISNTGYGLYGISTSNHGVYGTSNIGYGIYGTSTNSYGVYGTSTNSIGVYGISTSGYGLYGISTTGRGVSGISTNNYGVSGTSTNNPGVYGTSTNSYGIHGESTGSIGVYGISTSGYGLYGISTTGRGVSGISTSNHGVSGTSSSGYGAYGQSSTNHGVYGTSNIGYGVYGTSTSSYGVYGSSTDSTGVYGISNTGYGLYGISTTGRGVSGISTNNYGVSGTSTNNPGVYGTSTNSYGIHGDSTGSIGVYGISTSGYGLYGISTTGRGVSGISTSNHGVSGSSSSGYGVYGQSSTNYAGYFQGDVNITGTLAVTGLITKPAGSFKIDHPLDPAHKYLSHSFVESPDMLNIYNGNVLLDSNGEAVVNLPIWFEALNRDFRYQLTSIGQASPNLFIAAKISDNCFKIAGGKAGQEVSWLVTGIRQDAWANTNRIQVEEDKPEVEQGKYLHPEVFGLPREGNSIADLYNLDLPTSNCPPVGRSEKP